MAVCFVVACLALLCDFFVFLIRTVFWECSSLFTDESTMLTGVDVFRSEAIFSVRGSGFRTWPLVFLADEELALRVAWEVFFFLVLVILLPGRTALVTGFAIVQPGAAEGVEKSPSLHFCTVFTIASSLDFCSSFPLGSCVEQAFTQDEIPGSSSGCFLSLVCSACENGDFSCTFGVAVGWHVVSCTQVTADSTISPR